MGVRSGRRIQEAAGSAFRNVADVHRGVHCGGDCGRAAASAATPAGNAVFNDAQIASMKDRLELTKEQQPYWQAVEAWLREVVWDRSRGVRPKAGTEQPRAIKAGRNTFRGDALAKCARGRTYRCPVC